MFDFTDFWADFEEELDQIYLDTMAEDEEEDDE